MLIGLIVLVAIVYFFGYRDGASDRDLPGVASADAQEISPVEARDRDFYAPNSEDLAPDEMRLIACGTGMPTAHRRQTMHPDHRSGRYADNSGKPYRGNCRESAWLRCARPIRSRHRK